MGGGTETFNCTSLSATNYVALAENNGIVVSIYRGMDGRMKRQTGGWADR